MTVFRRPEAHALQSSQSRTSVKPSTTSHRRDHLPQVNRLSYRHPHKLGEHRRIQPHPTSTTIPSQHLLHVASLARSTVLFHSLGHHSSISLAVSLARDRGDTSSQVTLVTPPGLLDSCARSITTHQVTPSRVSSQHVGILVIRSRATVPWHLPGIRTSPSHHVHAVIQLVHGRVLAADVVLPVPVEHALAHGHLPTPVRHVPLASILGITLVLVEASALIMRLGHEASTTADSVSNLASHNRHIIATRVTVLG